ncbi:DUF29 domain-containing protein [Siccirubricoccus sp. KC 17139]|uniref:DUF29 domain-containing protein n=1 Tax=Siccirubricoccus soli TaxID=2899147 RepID=A0ABT1D599_9PROT|nr:DUF29 domain-containing protein [Siccirubricoccus soli]MCO6416470.1 DUF29 domain-containing protein [Siccirubricoccus soli]MCP2682604.1 DUF29 domain-containing protein [Siccirubricoccus soli]
MPDDLYHTDILAWSRAQADRLRRVAAGERVNDVDWAHVIEEVEDLGKSQLAGVESFLVMAILHALKVTAWPEEHPAVQHWEAEIANFLTQAQTRFEPGMRQHIDGAVLYRRALRQLRKTPMRGTPPLSLPESLTFDPALVLGEEFGTTDLLDLIRAA